MTCLACRIEAEIGTEENPHPVPARFHTCPALSTPADAPATAGQKVGICNVESPVGHHCLLSSGHAGQHQDRHGNAWPAPAEQGFGRCASLCAMPSNHRGGCVDAYGGRLSDHPPRPDEDGECRRCGGTGRILGGPCSTCAGRAPKEGQ